ncbi:ABC transporter substrate-binding protein [Baaleninema simplex]|uniref:ABC transporter substrate-binding protein n=1 Tax=Baaleninema simplex TaxID=2862350 RepID=UPI000370D8B5|nr:ABC transporter substrate-binding protein [Baaleninema simplex]
MISLQPLPLNIVFVSQRTRLSHVLKSRNPRGAGVILLFWATLGLVLLLAACQPRPASLKIGLNSWPGFDVIAYAEATDIFERRGLEVELVRFDNAQDTTRAMMRGALDAAFVNLWDVLQADPAEDSPTYIMVTNVSNGSDGIVAHKEISSVEDLGGRRVGAKLGTVNHLILLEALQLHGVPAQAVELADVSNEIAVTQLRDDRLDAAVLWEPLLSQTADEIGGQVIYTTRDTDSVVIDGLATRGEMARSRRTALKQLVLAWFDVMHAIETQPEEVFEIVAERLGQDPAAFAEDYAGLEKGNIALNREMFEGGRLKDAIAQLTRLFEADPRHGRLLREDLQVDAAPVMSAIEEWQP